VDYELAKILMDAGFPQSGKGRLIGSPNKLVWRSDDRVYVPTLEELIEACGKNFGSLDFAFSKTWRNASFTSPFRKSYPEVLMM
jgi:hypothetical protein